MLAQQMGTPGLIGAVHESFARLAQRQGKLLEAPQHYQEGLRIVQPLGHRLFVATCLVLMSTLADLPGAPLDAVQATRLLGAATAILQFEDMYFEPINLPAIQRSVATIRAWLDNPSFAAAWAEGQALTLDEATIYALEIG